MSSDLDRIRRLEKALVELLYIDVPTKMIVRTVAIGALGPYCGTCDGVGWVEGGPTIKTTCSVCRGTGWAKDELL